MIRRLLLTLLLVSAAIGSSAQAVPFITLRTSALEAAMGGASVANADDFLHGDNLFEAGIGKTFWQISAINYNLTNYPARVWAIPQLAIGLKCTTNSMGETELFSDNGQPLGTFRPSELCAALDITFKPISNVAIGVAGKIVRSSLSDQNSARCFATDLSLKWHIIEALTAGLAVENLGGKLDYGYGAYPLPTTYKAGIYGLLPIAEKHALEATAEAGLMPAYSNVLASIGAGYLFNHSLSLRLGAHISTKKEILPTYATVGVAYISDIFEIGGAYMTASNSLSISVKLKL